MPSTTLHELSPSGTPQTTYISTAHTTSSSGTSTSRLDVLPSQPAHSFSLTALSRTASTHLLTPFLPTNYPYSVTSDYTPYQVYDSLQAFLSTIASLLSSRAVLQSHGLGTTSAVLTATYATLLSILQESIGRVATIFFASYAGPRISSDVKFYRFLADIVNDVAFVLDVLSPSLPGAWRVPALCVSSCCRAICGVAGGSSKAILSAHFAKTADVGELNAKDGSQETVVSLVGMWVGGIVVSKVEGVAWTWIWMVVLLMGHLWANWKAVKSLRLRTLNRGRFGLMAGELIEGRVLGVEEVGKRESVFAKGGLLRDERGNMMGSCDIGVGVKELAECMGGKKKEGSGAIGGLGVPMEDLLDAFRGERYVLWFHVSKQKAVVMLKEGADANDQLKAWCHALRIAKAWSVKTEQHNRHDNALNVVRATCEENNKSWHNYCTKLEKAGWDLAASVLESTPGPRLRCQSQPSWGEKATRLSTQ